MVGFVADGGYDRDGAGEYGPRYGFRVETPQIFQRTAAARHDDDIGQSFRVQAGDGVGKVRGGLGSLHRCRRQAQFRQREAPPHHVLNVLPHRAAGRGNDADDAGEWRQRTLAGRVKQALGFQLLAQAGQFQGEGARPYRHGHCHLQIGFPVGSVESELPAGQNFLAFLQMLLSRTAAEHHTAEGAAVFPQAEIGMAGGHRAQVGYFALHRQSGQQPVGLKFVLEVGGHLGNGINGRRKHWRAAPGKSRVQETRSE